MWYMQGLWREVLVTIIALISTSVISTDVSGAEVKWDGGGGDGLWTNAQNWTGDILPGSTDKVILDNSYVAGSYEVSLGAGATQIVVVALEITPASTTIQLIIPASNTAVPALICAGEQYGLILNRGAVFVNASGAGSGATLVVTDSIRINNGGHYVHQTPRSHAENVRALSRAVGTEDGEFEFKIPVASSTISISGQVFGRLTLTPGQNGLVNYTGTGTNSLRIRSDLTISNGVNLSFNFEGVAEIGGNLVQEGGTMNLGSTARKMTMVVRGNISQAAGGVITETGTAQPLLVIGGWQQQQISLEGALTNEVTLSMQNSAGATARIRPDLPFKLELASGIITTGEEQLTLGEACILTLPAGMGTSFIHGPLRKRGLTNADFVFPVGSATSVRWVALKAATGDFTVRYMRGDPGAINNKVGEGLAHISALEYWQVSNNATNGGGKLELSFDDVNSGGVTELTQLKVAGLSELAWTNFGNTATSGSAGAAGSVTSQVVTGWIPAVAKLFTLSSSAANQNPLPLIWHHLNALRSNRANIINWEVEPGIASYFDLQRSEDGVMFQTLAMIPASGTKSKYQYEDYVLNDAPVYYRVIIIKPDASRLVSKIFRVLAETKPVNNILISAHINGINLRFPDARKVIYQMQVYDLSGRRLYTANLDVNGTQASVPIPRDLWRSNMIVITITDKPGNRITQKVLVR
jgi:hypothetical protein